MNETSLTTKPDNAPLILRPSKGWASLNLKDLWIYRELFYFLTWRDLKVRYKQTVLGAFWAIIQPFMQMVVFSILFGNIAQLDSEGLPYPIFTYAGLLPWGLFSKAIGDAGRSIVINRSMITKVYFPRLVVPMASVLSGVVDFMIAFVVLLGMMVYFNIRPTGDVWTLPLFILLALVTALGAGLWLSALNVIFRDVGYVIPYLTQFWFFVTPIIYSSTEVTGNWQIIYALNPMVGVVNGFRWALLGTETGPSLTLAVSAGIALHTLHRQRRGSSVVPDRRNICT